MDIFTFVIIIVASLGALYVGALVFAKAFTFLALKFQAFGMFLWNNSDNATRFVETVKANVAQFGKAVFNNKTDERELSQESVVEPAFIPEQNFTSIMSDAEWAEFDKPTYIRKGKTLIW